MNGSAVPPDRALARRFVLAAAFVAGLAAAGAQQLPAVHAQQAPTSPPAASKPAEAGADTPAPDTKPKSSTEITIGPHGIVVDGDGKRVRVPGGDAEDDAFNLTLARQPWIAGVVFLSVALVFTVPLLIVLAVIWYKVRRTRMLNETLLRLAEKGVPPPAAAIDALAAGRTEAAAQALAATAPAADQARIATRRAIWSDLRKGIVLIALGLGFALWGVVDDGTPNGFGLVLLFVGIGYVVLWWFEDRQIAPGPRSGGPSSGA